MSKADFYVCLQVRTEDYKTPIKGTRKFKNNLKGFKEFVDWCKKKSSADLPLKIVVEATGVYHEEFVYYLKDNTDFIVCVILPNKVKAFGKSLNIKTKTDKTDAKIISQMGIERELKEWEPMSPNLRQLRQLTRHRTQLLETKTAISNRLHAQNASYQGHKEVLKQLKALIRTIDKQLKVVEKSIEEIIEDDPVLKERFEKIAKVRGLGLITIAVVFAETNGFTLFTSRSQLISFCGYDIEERQSGSSVKGKTKISKKGNRYIRRALYYPAMTAAKYEPSFKNLHDRVFERTKIFKKANVAVQRKLLILIYTLFKKNEEYIPDYENKKAQQTENKENQEKKSSKSVGRNDVLPTVDDCSKAASLSQ